MKSISSRNRIAPTRRLFVSSLEQAVLAFVCENADRSFYGSELAGEAALSRGGVNGALRALARAGLLEVEDRGRMRFYRANLADARVRAFKTLLNVGGLSPLVERLASLSLRVVLFGSAASGTNLPGSDIDLLVVANVPDKVRRLLATVKASVEAVVVTPAGLADMDRDNPVFAAEMRRGIELWKGS